MKRTSRRYVAFLLVFVLCVTMPVMAAGAGKAAKGKVRNFGEQDTPGAPKSGELGTPGKIGDIETPGNQSAAWSRMLQLARQWASAFASDK
jgi:hypothetical protein